MRLKKIFALLLAAAASISSSDEMKASEVDTYRDILHYRETEAFRQWQNNKFSMFIHFGLYSELGGVWDGKPVEQGYSEQIQSFAGIFSDWYAMTADRFNPTDFNADEIVALAKDAGMKSIVITSKHHDGFCLFDTETTDFNSVDATPAGRDYIKEMSEACRKQGLKFGLYFSLIDWHYPYAYPISSHNCDFITPEHHEYNKKQVTELLSNYGDISEMWFDMGSLLPEQSRELYELVHYLQPDCLVSGRVGNDYYDFAVMGDNRYPDASISAPWQSAASMFNETWGYRSWQERKDFTVKAAEKMRSLIDVVSHGGNYLLNIGPKGDGSVVDFEEEVLLEIGKWLKNNGEAIYEASPSPFSQDFAWGKVTRKGNCLYLILSGKKSSKINLNITGNDLLYAKYLGADDEITYKQNKKGISLKLPITGNKETTDIPVIKLSFKDDIEVSTKEVIEAKKGTFTLNSANTVKESSYSCFDYYSNYKSDIAYNWTISDNAFNQIELIYTEAEIDKKIKVEIDDVPVIIRLADGEHVDAEIPSELVSQQNRYLKRRIGTFDADVTGILKVEDWKETESNVVEKSHPFDNYFILRKVEAPEDCNLIFNYASGNGTEILVNGDRIVKYLSPYRTVKEEGKVIVPLKKGENTILLRAYNRFEKEVKAGLKIDKSQEFYKMTVKLDMTFSDSTHDIRLTSEDTDSPHADAGLHNITLKLKK